MAVQQPMTPVSQVSTLHGTSSQGIGKKAKTNRVKRQTRHQRNNPQKIECIKKRMPNKGIHKVNQGNLLFNRPYGARLKTRLHCPEPPNTASTVKLQSPEFSLAPSSGRIQARSRPLAILEKYPHVVGAHGLDNVTEFGHVCTKQQLFRTNVMQDAHEKSWNSSATKRHGSDAILQ